MSIIQLVTTVKDLRIGHRGPMLISCFDGWPTGAALKAVAEAQAGLVKQYGKTVSLAIIPPVNATQPVSPDQLKPPDAERDAAVKASAQIGEQMETTTIASALVILPRGLIAVMIRSFVGAMSLLTRSRTPLTVFKEVAPAVAWLETLPGVPKSPGLTKDIEEWLTGPRSVVSRAAAP